MQSPRSFSNPTVRHRLASHLAGFAAALLAMCACFASPALAQDGPPPKAPISVDAQVAAGLLKEKDPPDYPTLAKVNYIQGIVRMQVFVAPSGKVSAAHVLQGHPFLAASALKAVRSWIYRPYRIGRKAVEFSTLVDFRFSLHAKRLSRFPPTAEEDLRERVTPPEVENPPPDPPSDDHIRIRVLVDSHGHPLDAEILPFSADILSGDAAGIREARQKVLHWKFRPAHWGALAVPWYLVVDVPVRHWPA
jgi:TonB family protein